MLGLRDVSQYRRWDENWLADEVGTASFPYHGLRTHMRDSVQRTANCQSFGVYDFATKQKCTANHKEPLKNYRTRNNKRMRTTDLTVEY
jgi:hypothetical protein